MEMILEGVLCYLRLTIAINSTSMEVNKVSLLVIGAYEGKACMIYFE